MTPPACEKKPEERCPVLEVKAPDDCSAERIRRLARSVLTACEIHFDERLLCFFDEEGWPELECQFPGNRGVHIAVTDKSNFVEWPLSVKNCIFPDADKCIFDQIIYLHGSTCADEVGLTMTFAHELQHAVQHVRIPNLLKANNLVSPLSDIGKRLNLQWADIPVEREARAIAKRVTTSIHGRNAVDSLLARRFISATGDLERADVEFITSLDPSAPYNVETETLALFRRLRPYRAELETKLKSYPDSKDINLNDLMPPEVS
jgi:hypothetical protein